MREGLPPALELDVLDRDAAEGQLEVLDGAQDGSSEAVCEGLGGERVWGLDDGDAAAAIEARAWVSPQCPTPGIHKRKRAIPFRDGPSTS